MLLKISLFILFLISLGVFAAAYATLPVVG